MPLNIIEDNSLQATEDGYQVEARLTWYRSMPLTCIEKVQLSLDGQPVPSEAIRFGINGHQYKVDELPAQTDEYWFVLDSAVLGVHDPGRVKRGESHQIELHLSVRAPYIPIAPGKFMVHAWQYSTTQVAG